MASLTSIIKEHRKAAKEQRRKLRDPEEARKFLIRAGILAKNGQRLARQYR